jgi:GT2 family glycosyltransferase
MPRVTFPRVDKPIVSVVVLAWRQTDRLISCLASLLGSVDAPAFEVVLVLNGASDDVRALVESQVSGTTNVSVERNLGFGGGCNVGVQNSRGTHILFLNDDVSVDEGLLAALSSRLDAESDVAAVAALLVNPDGSLQEAGSRILAGGGTAQLGAGLSLDSNAAEGLLVARDIDYGSAAALMVTRRRFDSIGGFDPLYEPAYFEDVDLALRLKERGWRVVLEPKARATHTTGSSTATDTRFRHFAADHAGTEFASRWGHLLERAADRDAPPEVLLPVPRFERAPATRPDQSPIETAASIAENYARWLNAQLDAVESAGAASAAALVTAQQQIAVLDEKVASLNDSTHRLRERLDDLEARGPIGVVKWQLGLVKLRHDRRNG